MDHWGHSLPILLNTLAMCFGPDVAFIAKMPVSEGLFHNPTATLQIPSDVLDEVLEIDLCLVQAIALEGALQLADDRIAARAEKPANFPGVVVVIDAETASLYWLRLTADVANALLPLFNYVVLLWGQLIAVH